MPQKTETLFRKLTILLFLVLLVLTACQIGLMLWMFLRVSNESEQRLMFSSAVELGELIQPYIREYPEHRELEREMRAFTTANPRLGVYLLSEDGTLLGEFNRYGPIATMKSIPQATLVDLAARLGQRGFPQYGPDPANGARSVIYSIAPLTVLGKPGYLYLVLNNMIAADVYGMTAENASMVSILAFFLGSSFIAGLLGYILLRYLKRRLDRVVTVVHRIAENDLQVRVQEHSHDEIGALGRSVNAMADRLQQSVGLLAERDNLRRQLIADVSHDLRGPVSSIKGFLEVLSGMKQDAFVERFPKILPSLVFSTDSLERLLTELFELAKFEAREKQPERIIFEFDALVEEVLASCGGLAAKKGVSLQCVSSGEKILVCGDTNLLHRALQNLVANAISYSPEGGVVRVQLAVKGGEVEVRIVDEGSGIAPEDAARIFQRFEKGSNSEHQSRQSTGLGLAIVQQILRLHGSKAELLFEQGSGAIFSFRLPIKSSAT